MYLQLFFSPVPIVFTMSKSSNLKFMILCCWPSFQKPSITRINSSDRLKKFSVKSVISDYYLLSAGCYWLVPSEVSRLMYPFLVRPALSVDILPLAALCSVHRLICRSSLQRAEPGRASIWKYRNSETAANFAAGGNFKCSWLVDRATHPSWGNLSQVRPRSGTTPQQKQSAIRDIVCKNVWVNPPQPSPAPALQLC